MDAVLGGCRVGWMPCWCTGEEPGNETSRQPGSLVDAVLGGCHVGALGRSLGMRPVDNPGPYRMPCWVDAMLVHWGGAWE